MDPRSPLARLGALAAALLIVVGGVDRAYAAAHCPHHGAVPPASATAHAHAAPVPGPADEAPAHGHCTCIGACTAGAAFAPTPGATAALPAPPAPRLASAEPDATPVTPARRDHQLPFATAPPTDR